MESQKQDTTANNQDKPYYSHNKYNNSYSNRGGYKHDYYTNDRNYDGGYGRGRGESSYRGRGGDGQSYRGRGRGGRGGYQQQQEQTEQKTVTKTEQPKPQLKKKGEITFTNDYERAFGILKDTEETTKNDQPTQQKEEIPQEQAKKAEVVKHIEVPQQEKEPVKEQVQEEAKQERKNYSNGHQNTEYKPRTKNSAYTIKKEQRDYYKSIAKAQQQEEDKKESKQCDESKVTSQKTQQQAEELKKEEKPKVPVKQDFVPDENFSWDLDLESTNKGKKNKDKGKSQPGQVIPVVIKQSHDASTLNQDVRIKMRNDIEFSMSYIDKVNKGLTNTKNSCYMNVCLQSLISSPPFFNMLLAIGQSKEIMSELDEGGLLIKFIHFVRFFNPGDQLDKSSEFACKVVDTEAIFAEMIYNFNPYHEHQDCHEFLALLLDKLNDELALIYQPEETTTNNDGAWQETGDKKLQKHFNNDQQHITQSLVRDIFGGILRTEFHVEGRKEVTVTFEPFFVLNLEINRCEDLQSCLHSYFDQKQLNDYKVGGREVKAYHQQQIEKLPVVLILQLKRFIYKDKPIKMKEDIEFPEVLTIEDQFVSTQLKLGAFHKIGSEKGRQYRLFSVINHKGMTIAKGHYVTYILDAKDDWILYDDNKFRKVNKDTVLESQAYLLFYELIQ